MKTTAAQYSGRQAWYQESNLFFKVVVAVKQVLMAEPPFVLHVDMMVKAVGPGLVQLDKQNI